MDENGVGNSSALPPVPSPAQQPASPYSTAPAMVSSAAQSVDGMMSQSSSVPLPQQITPSQGQYGLQQPVQPVLQPPSAPVFSGYNEPQASSWGEKPVGQFSTIQDPEGVAPNPSTYDPYAILSTEPMPEITIGSPSGRGGGILFKLIVGILVIAIFAAGIYGGYLYGKNSSQEASVSPPAQELPTQTTELEEVLPPQSEDYAKIDFTLQAPVYKDEVLKSSVGKQVNAGDGLVVYVKDDVTFDYKTTDPNYKQSSDKKLIKVNYIVGNASKSGSKQIKASMFSLEDSVGTAIVPEGTIAEYVGKVDVLDLEPGAKARFSVVYEVGSYVGDLKVVRQQSYVIKSTDKSVAMRMEVNLSEQVNT